MHGYCGDSHGRHNWKFQVWTRSIFSSPFVQSFSPRSDRSCQLHTLRVSLSFAKLINHTWHWEPLGWSLSLLNCSWGEQTTTWDALSVKLRAHGEIPVVFWLDRARPRTFGRLSVVQLWAALMTTTVDLVGDFQVRWDFLGGRRGDAPGASKSMVIILAFGEPRGTHLPCTLLRKMTGWEYRIILSLRVEVTLKDLANSRCSGILSAWVWVDLNIDILSRGLKQDGKEYRGDWILGLTLWAW